MFTLAELSCYTSSVQQDCYAGVFCALGCGWIGSNDFKHTDENPGSIGKGVRLNLRAANASGQRTRRVGSLLYSHHCDNQYGFDCRNAAAAFSLR